MRLCNERLATIQIQWGSKNQQKCLVFVWSKVDQFTNGPVFEWDSKTSPDFKWSKIKMAVKIISLDRFLCFWYSNVRFSTPTVHNFLSVLQAMTQILFLPNNLMVELSLLNSIFMQFSLNMHHDYHDFYAVHVYLRSIRRS